MSPSDTLLSRIYEFAGPLYSGKDTMHDLSHIERVSRRANQLSRNVECDSFVLSAATYLHGVIYSHEAEIRTLLHEERLEPDRVELIVHVAWESQKESTPVTIEGRVLHDAHMMEGDENFIITKTLVTGSARGQSLSETVEYFERHIDDNECVLPENKTEYEQRKAIAVKFMTSLRASL